MKRRFLFTTCFLLIIAQSCSTVTVRREGSASTNPGGYLKGGKISNADLAAWKVMGGGTVAIDSAEKAVRVAESADSKGITLVSTGVYPGNTVITFKVKPEQYKGVCVVLLSASDKNARGIDVPAGNDGSLAFWSEGTVQDYMFAFHTGFHQPNIFIRKYPGAVDIVQTKDIAPDQKWYTIEIGQKGPRLWLKVDGKIAVEGNDPDGKGLPGGNIGLRLRGPGDGSYSCLFKDMTIKTE
jgi:hypothetical protein